MKPNEASGTAQRVALRRAAHQLLDKPPVFDDPLAVQVLGMSAADLQAALRQEAMPLAPNMRAFMAARSRYVEDRLAAGVERGVRQYVVLGAGLDTFACRNPYSAQQLHVFEADYPATQAWKTARLQQVGLAPQGHVTFAPIDLEAQTLEEGLRAAGFRATERTFFSWLGVTQYLAAETVMRTLQFMATMPPGSGVVFDYGLAPHLLGPDERRVFEAIARRVAAAGEPWRANFEPARLMADLRALGFAQVEDLSPQTLNEMYFKDREDGLRAGRLAHLMRAEV